MDILIILLIVLLAAWYVVRRFRATMKNKESSCADCDGTTCKHAMQQDCRDEEE